MLVKKISNNMESRYVKKYDLELLKTIESNSVDLVLTDPPYIISKKSGMQSHSERKPGDKGYEQKSKQISKLLQEDGTEFENGITLEIEEIDYGRRFAVQTDYGDWDKDYTLDDLEKVINEFYRILREGGSCIIFFDLWKMETLKDLLSKFSKHRLIEWIKTNPMPINQHATYLSNAREMAISCVKGGKATFNSKYDKGIYEYPIYNGKDRFHPTQKSLPLFEELIKKHSNEGDTVVDPYAGSGTTALAAKNTNRLYLCCEPSDEYFQRGYDRVNNLTNQ
jgi:site-specific DNA-methyltransferase (adenine-specific)|tara:strand:+ start:461 stop:1300 length:840 start_codon:yes stop_codon:yes gene_type:complete